MYVCVRVLAYLGVDGSSEHVRVALRGSLGYLEEVKAAHNMGL